MGQHHGSRAVQAITAFASPYSVRGNIFLFLHSLKPPLTHKDILRNLAPAVSPQEGQGLADGRSINTYTASLHIEIACVENPIIGMAVAQTFVQGMEIIDRSAERPLFLAIMCSIRQSISVR